MNQSAPTASNVMYVFLTLKGAATRRILELISELEAEGLL